MKIAVIGAGNGGQAIAGYLGMMGHKVNLYERSLNKVGRIIDHKGVFLTGEIEGFGKVALVTDKIQECIENCPLIMVVTTADAHAEMAENIAPFLKDGQVLVLNPGRTLGAVEVKSRIKSLRPNLRVFVAETQSLIYACRVEIPGTVRIIGVKKLVPIAAYPKMDIDKVLDLTQPIYPAFKPVSSTLITGLENIGAIFHPGIIIANASRIERGESFYFYNDITPGVANILENLDRERCEIGAAYGIQLRPAIDWIVDAYDGIEGETLYDRMKNNPAYAQIRSPQTLNSRLLFEDIPTGLVPMIELGRLVGLEMRIMESLVNISSVLLNKDFYLYGRTLRSLFSNSYSKQLIKEI